MSVDLEPTELGFKRPFTQEVSQVLRLRNPNAEPVAFKVKTTAPKQYCVRPNSGRIEGHRFVEVQVLLQAMKEDPPPDARCRDKFLVQSVAINATHDSPNIAQVWASIELTAKSTIQEKKIRVNFLPADGSAGAAAATTGAGLGAVGGAAGAGTTTSQATNGVTPQHQQHPLHSSNDEEQPPAYSSHSPSTAGPGALAQNMSTPASSIKPRDSSYATDNSPSAAGRSSSAQQQQQSSSTLASVAAVLPGVSEQDLQRQLDAANARVSSLQAQVSEGLRARGLVGKMDAGDKSADTTGAGGQTLTQQLAHPQAGVPVHYVAGLCLLSFLLAFFFF